MAVTRHTRPLPAPERLLGGFFLLNGHNHASRPYGIMPEEMA
jgi:hypothetical protein